MNEITKQTSEFLDKDQVLTDILKNVPKKQFKNFKNSPVEKLPEWKASVGQWIKNIYKINHPENPISKKWLREVQLNRMIGEDISPNSLESHPDSIIFEILKELHKRLNAK